VERKKQGDRRELVKSSTDVSAGKKLLILLRPKLRLVAYLKGMKDKGSPDGLRNKKNLERDLPYWKKEPDNVRWGRVTVSRPRKESKLKERGRGVSVGAIEILLQME